MKKAMKSSLSILLTLLSLLFMLPSCAKSGDGTGTPSSGGSDVPSPATTAAAAETFAYKYDHAAPVSNEDILALYTLVMNGFKADAPSFYYTEYQMFGDAVYIFNSFDAWIYSLIDKYLTPQKAALASPCIHRYGEDMSDIVPVRGNKKGCLLTDVTAIKSAVCTDMGDGTFEIDLVLNDETAPQPAAKGATVSPSATGAVFDPALDLDFQSAMQQAYQISVTKITPTYSGCTATVIFSSADLKVLSVTQIMTIYYHFDVNDMGRPLSTDPKLRDVFNCYDVDYDASHPALTEPSGVPVS